MSNGQCLPASFDVADPCVIVSASVELPEIATLKQLWNFIVGKGKIEASDFNAKQTCDNLSLSNAGLLSNWNFVNQYGISLSELRHMDPQQYLAIHVINKAMQSLNLPVQTLQGLQTGIFVGVMAVDHLHRVINDNNPPDSRFFLNHCEASIANRASHYFNFSGESKAINAACASSLIALKDACLNVQAGKCDFVFVVGVNYINSKQRYQSFHQAGMLSRSGHCHTFANNADGYIPLEGACCLLVTRQSLAQALHLKPLATIKSIDSNHNGTTPTMTAPSVASQSALLARVKQKVEDLDIAYVEAHGTGTNLGDPIELEAINQQYPGVYVGSIKANMGHLEAGAGLLGVIKALLILEHRTIPPHRLQGQQNLLIPSGLKINQDTVAYPNKHIAISSFGFGGSNAHAILERVDVDKVSFTSNTTIPLLIAAKDWASFYHFQDQLLNHYQRQAEKLTHFAMSQLQHAHMPAVRKIAWIDGTGTISKWQERQGPDYYLNLDFTNKAACDELREFCQSYLPSPIAIEASEQALDFVLSMNYPEFIPIYVDGQNWWLFDGLDNYVEVLCDLPNLSEKQFALLVNQSQELYRFQYTFKAFAHASSNPVLLSCLQQSHAVVQENWLILHLLWLRVQLTQKWSLHSVEREFLQTFPWQYQEWIALLKQHVVTFDEVIATLNQSSAKESLCIRLQQQAFKLNYCELPRLKALRIQQKKLAAGKTSQASFILNMSSKCFITIRAIALQASPSPSINYADVLSYCWLNGVDVYWSRFYQNISYYREGFIISNYSDANLYAICHHYFSGESPKETLQLQFQGNPTFKHYEQFLCSLHDLIDKQPKMKPTVVIDSDEIFFQHASLLLQVIGQEFGTPYHGVDKLGRNYQHSLVKLKPLSNQTSSFVKNGHYVIVGGSGGLGITLCHYLRQTYQAQVTLIGRKAISELSQAARQSIDSIHVHYIQCDIAHHEQLLNHLKALSNSQPIDALFHLAIETHDTLFKQLPIEQLKILLKQRWQANAWLLSDKLQNYVNAIHVFSSVQAYYPNLGSSLYGYEALIKSILLRQSLHPRKTLTYLGVVDGVGLAAQKDYSAYLNKYGMAAISPHQLLNLLECQLANQVPEAIVTAMKDQHIPQVLLSKNEEKLLSEYVTLSLFCHLHDKSGPYQGHFQLLYDELQSLWNEANLSSSKLDNYQQKIDVLRQQLEQGDYQQRLNLFDSVLVHYEAILNGSIPAHQVIFPSGQTDLVKAFYSGHTCADFANEALAREVRHLLDNKPRLRILEVGAGSGATTKHILSLLKSHDQVDYTFTDISQALVNKARLALSSLYSNMTFYRLNIEDIRPGHDFEQQYDIIIATNVLHATPSIVETLKRLQLCLKNEGWLLINELVEKTPFTTAIFGLFDGWWKTKDKTIRQANSPLLNHQAWHQAIEQAGLKNVKSSGSALHIDTVQQQVMVAAKALSLNAMSENYIEAKVPPSTLSQSSLISNLIPDQLSSQAGAQPTPSKTLIDYLKAAIAATLHIDSTIILESEKLSELGFDSLSLSDLYQKLLKYAPDLSVADLFSDHCVASLARHLEQLNESSPLQNDTVMTAPIVDTDIAIVGLSYQLPHGDYASFEAMLDACGTAFGNIPSSRWAHEHYFSDQPGPGYYYAQKGSFLKDIDCFDAAFFNLSLREARLIDPQERLLLQNAYHALEEGRCLPIKEDNQIGVFAALSGNYYSWLYDWQSKTHANSACSYWSAANRISYTFNLHGPSLTVDTACSSSLTALHLACQSLLTGETDIALAAAANLIVHPRQMVELSDMKMLSPTNQNNSFSSEGDGFVYAEGVVVVCLKRLSQAITDGNYIHAVIKATAINAGGKTHGYTVPNTNAQAKLIQTALSRANLKPEQIAYVETHGTATKLGDPIETKALTNVFKHTLPIASVKSNMGHSEACAGFAGLVKLILQYRNQCLYASANALPVNPYCGFDQNNLQVLVAKQDWQTAPGLRYVGLSSFGAGGANGHVILQDYVNSTSNQCYQPFPVYQFAKQRYWYNQKPQQVIKLNKSAYYFNQHRLFGRPILPGVAHVYFMAQQAFVHFKTSYLQFDEIKWQSPIICSEMDAFINIHCDIQLQDNVLQLKLHGISQYSSLQARVIDVDSAVVMISDKINSCNHAYPTQQIYQRFCDKGWQHGPAFQGIKALWVDDTKQCCLATIVLNEEVNNTDLTFDPRLFDSVLQCVSVLQADLPANQVYIPQSIKHLKLYRAWPKSFQVLCEVVEDTANRVCYNIYVADQEGIVLTAIEAFCMVPIHLKQIIQEKQLVYFQLSWRLLLTKISTTLAEENITFETPVITNYEMLKHHMLQLKQSITAYRNKKYIAVFASKVSNRAFAFAWHGFVQTLKAEYSWFDYLIYIIPNEFSQLRELPYSSDLSGLVLADLAKQLFTSHYQFCKFSALTSAFKMHGNYVISGGFGGIARQLASYLVKRYQAKILLLGRRAPDTEQAWLTRQPTIDYQQVNVCDASHLLEVITRFRQQYGSINGVIHAAGWQQDRLLHHLESDDIDAVVPPKLNGAVNLDKCLADEKLDFYLLLSSYASILPNAGQAHYAAANAYLDSFAHARELNRLAGKRYGRTITLNSPLWAATGMTVSEAAKTRMRQAWGMEAISAEEGLAMIEQVLSSEAPQIIGFMGDVERFQTVLQQSTKPIDSATSINKTKNPTYPMINKIEHIIANIIEHQGPLDCSKSFGDLGYNSITLTELAIQLNEIVDEKLTAASFYDYDSIEEFLDKVGLIQTEVETITPPLNSADFKQQAVIVGYHALLPGCISLENFWQILCQKKQIINKTPEFRKAWMKEINAAFLDEVDQFDTEFFNLSPLEARVIDPQQRLLLQTVWHALEHSGIKPSQLKSSNTGVFVGASTFDYFSQLIKHQTDNPYIPLGSVHSLLANRISYFFDLKGPSEAVDTACSSGLYALHKAMQALQKGECDTAIVCGVNLLLDDTFFASFTASGMLSVKGQCTPFDEQADGYIRGEGIVAIILQTKTVALAQNNTIHACLLNSSVNHGGKANTLTSPSSKAHRQLYEAVYSAYDLNQVTYLETHGTGTPIGDPIEINGIQSFFHASQTPLYLGSLKANIGHLEPASGLASVIKVLLMMKYQQIPGQAGLTKLNPQINLTDRFIISTETQSWISPQAPFTAGINSFGFGGVNAHVLLQQWQSSTLLANSAAIELLLPISANSKNALIQNVKAFKCWLQTFDSVDVTRLCAHLQFRREHLRYRVVFVWEDREKLLASLDSFIADFNDNIPMTSQYAKQIEIYRQGGPWPFQSTEGLLPPCEGLPYYVFDKRSYWFAEPEIDVFYHEQLQPYALTSSFESIEHEIIAIIHAGNKTVCDSLDVLQWSNQVHWFSLESCNEHQLTNLSLNRVIIILSEQACSAIEHLFTLLKGLAISYQTQAIKIQLMIQCVNIVLPDPMAAAVDGLFASLNKEHPAWLCQAYLYTQQQKDLYSFINQWHPEGKTLYINNSCYYQLDLLKSAYESKQPFLQNLSTVIVMGGFGGIGALVCDYLLQRYAVKLIVIGRKLAGADEHDLLHKYPGAIDYLAVDVTRPNEVKLATKYLGEKYKTIDAVFNLVMQLQDATVVNMSWSAFQAVFAAKRDSIEAVKQLCQQLHCQKVVLFSSVQSYACLAGQANYAAASKYLDAFAKATFISPDYELRLLNWSIWQDVGAVSNPYYLKQARALGYEPISSEMGLKWMEMALNGTDSQVIIQQRCDKSILPFSAAQETGYTKANTLVIRYINALERNKPYDNQDLFTYLLSQVLNSSSNSSEDDVESMHQQCIIDDPDYQALYELCYYCYQHYTSLLNNQITGNQFLFSQHGSALLEHLYTDLPESKACNEAIALYINKIATQSEAAQALRVLELGAGLGATTKCIIPGIKTQQNISYCYSDVSPYFLARGELIAKQFSFPLTTQQIDINQLKDLPLQSYEVVIASNVLHLASDLDHCLQQLHRILAPGGKLIINEGCQQQLALNFIFGVFDIWRLQKQHAVFSHSPLLKESDWHVYLEKAGFRANTIYTHQKNQVVLAAEKPIEAVKLQQQMSASVQTLDELKAILRTSLQMKPDQSIDITWPLAELGLDSITGVGFIAAINAKYALSLKASIIFSYPTLHALHQYILGLLEDKRPLRLDPINVANKTSVKEQERKEPNFTAVEDIFCGDWISE